MTLKYGWKLTEDYDTAHDTEEDDGDADLLPSDFRLSQKSAEPGLFHISLLFHEQRVAINIIIAITPTQNYLIFGNFFLAGVLFSTGDVK